MKMVGEGLGQLRSPNRYEEAKRILAFDVSFMMVFGFPGSLVTIRRPQIIQFARHTPCSDLLAERQIHRNEGNSAGRLPGEDGVTGPQHSYS